MAAPKTEEVTIIIDGKEVKANHLSEDTRSLNDSLTVNWRSVPYDADWYPASEGRLIRFNDMDN